MQSFENQIKNQKRELLCCQAATSNNLCEYSLLQAKCSFIYIEALDFSSNSTKRPFFSSDPDVLNTGKTCRIWHKRQKKKKKGCYRHTEKLGEEAGSGSLAHCHGVGHLPHPLVFILLLLLLRGWLIPTRAMPVCRHSEPFTPTRVLLPPCPAPSPVGPTHRSSLSSRFCPWATQRWCCLAAQTGCPGSWPGRSENHCPPQSRCGSLPSPSWTCCWWACSWWICVRRDLWGKEAKAWPCLAESPSYSSNSSQDLTKPKAQEKFLIPWKWSGSIYLSGNLLEWPTLAESLAPGGCNLIHFFYLWSHLDWYHPHATRTGQCRLWFS